MARSDEPARRRGRATESLSLVGDVLVIGGGPAGAWAALAARAAGCEVILVDKGFFGTSGATAPSNTETWVARTAAERERAAKSQEIKTRGLCNPGHVDRVLDEAFRGLSRLGTWSYPFPVDAEGKPYIGNLRGPDYMRFMRRRVIGAGVQVLDHHPALELLGDDDGVAGAAGVDRQRGNPWRARTSAVVLATGGCAFGERILGATGLTGDGYLMAMEAGAVLSGMEMSSQYAVTPAGSSLNKGMTYRWASFFDADGRDLGDLGDDRQVTIASALQKGPVYARLDKATAQERDWLRRGQPNCFLPFDRAGLDPFTNKFEVTLRCEGTVRGVGGIRVLSERCETDVPGLYAAGDVASREDLTGAITGGGGPNASWAIASGNWAGRAAGAYARDLAKVRDTRAPRELGRFALGPARRRASVPQSTDVFETVRDRMLPLEHNFYRTSEGLAKSLQLIDALWRGMTGGAASSRQSPSGLDVTRSREAAALLATSRWALSSAIARRDTRGMHRRADYPDFQPAAPRRLLVRGIDEIKISGAAGTQEVPP